jgi:hypothetical protein
MPTLWFHTFDTASEAANGPVLQKGTINIGATATLGDMITGKSTGDKRNRTVRVFTDADCYIAWGDADTEANATDVPIRSEDAEYFHLNEGDYISVIERSAT